MELGCYRCDIMYQPGKDNIPADTLSRAHGGVVINKEKLSDFQIHLCHPRIIRLAHFVRIQNLPYFIENIKRVCSEFPVCIQLKP